METEKQDGLECKWEIRNVDVTPGLPIDVNAGAPWTSVWQA